MIRLVTTRRLHRLLIAVEEGRGAVLGLESRVADSETALDRARDIAAALECGNARLTAERDQARRAFDGAGHSLDILVTLARAAVRDADLGGAATGVDHLREFVADLAEHAPALETYASGADLIDAETGKTTWAEVAQ